MKMMTTLQTARNLKASAQILKLLIEKKITCGDEELDEHSDCS